MTPDTVIDVRHLGKRYALGSAAGPAYRTLRDTLSGVFRRRPPGEPFWAVRDVSFQVRRGEVLGVVGRNGAGKSTLLKLLSRITEPTEGEADICGRVGSLLEVGTGFHPELSGRENVYLNGVILGMSRREVAGRFDEIVAFAEVEQFLDTPVKHYSSGMYTRLAFAVAAHLDTEILVVDEVLAVGDAAFQAKCLGKMGEVAKGGRTVLFVSHNMSAVRQLCTTGLLLDAGRVRRSGPAAEVINEYLGLVPKEQAEFPGGPLKSVSARQTADGLEIVATYRADAPLPVAGLGFTVADDTGRPLFGANPRTEQLVGFGKGESAGTITVTVREPRLRDGRYRLSIWFGDGASDFVTAPDCLTFEVTNTRGLPADPRVSGPVAPLCDWRLTPG